MSRATSSTASVNTQHQQHNVSTQVPREKIAMRAYEKWCKRGRPHGSDKQDWVDAENELRQEMSRAGTQGNQTQTRR